MYQMIWLSQEDLTVVEEKAIARHTQRHLAIAVIPIAIY